MKHYVKATSFADPMDVKAFKKCKALGKSDMECFKVGDNGEGFWGDDTTSDEPLCALPREEWKGIKTPNKKKVKVTVGQKSIICRLGDTMPSYKNIKNGAALDLNYAACRALGVRPPAMVNAIWEWSE